MVVNSTGANMETFSPEQGSKAKVVDGNNNSNNNQQGSVNNNLEATGQTDGNNNSNNDSNCQDDTSVRIPVTASVKYQLRPRSLQTRRFYDDWPLQDTIIRHKPRPPPLSRYRRKTANARERHRMRQINTAFESLRGVLPSWVCSRRAATDLTKITTLRLASAYIQALQDILDGNADEETYPWVLSNILGGGNTSPTSSTSSSSSKDDPKVENPSEATIIKTQLSPPYTTTEGDFVSFLCSSSNTSTVLEDNLEFPYLSSMAEGDDMSFFLGCESPRNWQPQQQQTPLVT